MANNKKINTNTNININTDTNIDTTDDEFQLPPGISESDIMVPIDIDYTSSDHPGLKSWPKTIYTWNFLTNQRRNSGDNNPRKQCNRQHREFEETVHQGILDDLTT